MSLLCHDKDTRRSLVRVDIVLDIMNYLFKISSLNFESYVCVFAFVCFFFSS